MSNVWANIDHGECTTGLHSSVDDVSLSIPHTTLSYIEFFLVSLYWHMGQENNTGFESTSYIKYYGIYTFIQINT